MKKIKQLPTVLGLLILLAGVTAGVFLIKEGRGQFLRASPEITPKQVKITNITDNSFTISWITDTPTSGFVKYGSDEELTFTGQDDRDEISGQSGSFSTHYVTLRGLKLRTTYFFKIFSEKKGFDDNGQNYQKTTAPTLQTPQQSDVAYGTIVKSDGSPAEGVIVYLSLKNAVLQSDLTKTSGSWTIPLSSIRASSLTSYVAYDPEASTEEIFVQGADLGTATAIAVTKNDSPMPTITLGQAFDFQSSLEQTTPDTSQTDTTQGRFPPETVPSPAEETLTIINPTSNEEVNTLKPEFLGTGPAGETLTVTVQSSQALSDQITIDEDGTWNWTPPDDLSPGEHTITITLADGQSISRLFTVLAAGTDDLPSFSATPSAVTLTPSPTPSIVATPSPTSTPSGRVSLPSTESGVLEPGSLTPTFLFFIMGTVLISTGLFFNIFLKKFFN